MSWHPPESDVVDRLYALIRDRDPIVLGMPPASGDVAV